MSDVNEPASGDTPRSGRRVLVITTVARSAAALRKVIGDEIDELRVVVPVVHKSRLQW
jgi:hypothetical protein